MLCHRTKQISLFLFVILLTLSCRESTSRLDNTGLEESADKVEIAPSLSDSIDEGDELDPIIQMTAPFHEGSIEANSVTVAGKRNGEPNANEDHQNDQTEEDKITIQDILDYLSGLFGELLNGNFGGNYPDDNIDSTDKPFSFVVKNLKIQMNGMDAITENVLPNFADQNGLEDFAIDDDIIIFSGEKEILGCNYYWSVKILNSELQLPMDDQSLAASFLDNSIIHTKWDVPEATATGKIRIRAYAPSWACPDIDETKNTSGSGFKGEMDFVMDYKEDENVLYIKDIVNASLYLTKVHTEETTGFVKKILEWLAEKLIFSDLPDDYETEVMNYIFKKNNTVKDKLKKTVNDMLSFALNVTGKNEEVIPFEYATKFEGFQTSDENHLNTAWDIYITTNKPANPCARYLGTKSYHKSKGPIPELGDFTVGIPFGIITKSLYGVGQTGAFCWSYTLKNESESFLEIILEPYGDIQVKANTDPEDESMIQMSLPFKANINFGDLSQNLITGTLNIGLKLNVNCKSGLFMSIQDVSLSEVNGTLSFEGFDFDVSLLEDTLDQLIRQGTSHFPLIPLASKITAIPEAEPLAIEVHEILTQNKTIYMGLNLIDKDVCEDLEFQHAFRHNPWNVSP